MTRHTLVFALLALVGCSRKPAPEAPVVLGPGQVDLSESARAAAVVDALTAEFATRVQAQLNAHVSVRGLARSIKANPRSELNAANYSTESVASARVEVLSGKIRFTSRATLDAPSAAVIEGNGKQFRIPYEASAEVGPDGELRDVVVLSLGEAVVSPSVASRQ